MKIGHIFLGTTMNGTGEHLIRLVEALDRQGVRQHVLVANQSLAKRVRVYENVDAGPVVRSPVTAYCLMPDVEVAHVHDGSAGQAGLLLTLTRSIPYVLSRRSDQDVGRSPVVRSMLNRAATVICANQSAADALLREEIASPVEVIADLSHDSVESDLEDNRSAARHLRIYRRAVDSLRVPAMLL